GEVLAIGDPDPAPLIDIAEELSLTGNHCPEEGEQRLAARLNPPPPELMTECLDVRDSTILTVHQGSVGSAEDFLPAQAVGRHQHDVASRSRGRRRITPSAEGSARDKQDQESDSAAVSHDVSLRGSREGVHFSNEEPPEG